MFTAEEARKLAKEVKDEKELLAKQEQEKKYEEAVKVAENIVNKTLEDINQAIIDDKDSIKVNLSEYSKDVEKVFVSKIKNLGFNIKYVTEHINSSKTSEIKISWNEPELSTSKITNKEFDDLIRKIFDKPHGIFTHPTRWVESEFPRRFFL